MVVQPTARPDPPGVRALAKRTTLSSREPDHDQAEGRMGGSSSTRFGYTPGGGGRCEGGDPEQPQALKCRAAFLGALRRHHKVRSVRQSHGNSALPAEKKA